MSNGSESLYIGRRSDLEILLDVVYVLADESRPLSTGYLARNEKVGTMYPIVKKILEKCEKKSFVTSIEVGTRKKYELTQHGKELIYTWLDYIYHPEFNLKNLLKSRYVESLPEKENSRLKEIMEKQWRKPNYKNFFIKSGQTGIRTPIMKYRDLLMYLKFCYMKKLIYKATNRKKPIEAYKDWIYRIDKESNYLRYSYATDIMDKIVINYNVFKKLKEFGFNLKKKHLETRIITGFERDITKKGSLLLHGNIQELISITPEGIKCADTFDKIMMEFELTDLVFTSGK